MVSVEEVNRDYGYWDGNLLKMADTTVGKMYLPQSEPDDVWHHWEQRTTWQLGQWLKHDSHFMDIGANFGYFVLDAARIIKDGTICAVEPHPFVYAILRLNVELHELRNVKTCKAAITDGSTKLINFFYYDGANGFGRTYDPSAYNTNSWRRYIVRAYGLDHFADKPVDVVKIDIEGSECDVLMHASRFYDSHEGSIIIMDLHHPYITEQKGEAADMEFTEFLKTHFDILYIDVVDRGIGASTFCVLRI